MAQSCHIWIHQYLVIWLIQAKDRKKCYKNTQSLLALVCSGKQATHQFPGIEGSPFSPETLHEPL